MKGIPPHGFPRTMEHGLEVVCVSVSVRTLMCVFVCMCACCLIVNHFVS